MTIWNKIKKFCEGPIMYDEYMRNEQLNVGDLTKEEFDNIKTTLNLKLKYYGIDVSETEKTKHLIKEINLFERFYPYNYDIAFKQGMDYREFMEKCLEYHFEHLNEEKNMFNFFSGYLRHKLHKNVTDRQLLRYLNGHIRFDEIKTYFEELHELGKGLKIDLSKYVIGYDSVGNYIFDEELINKLKTNGRNI